MGFPGLVVFCELDKCKVHGGKPSTAQLHRWLDCKLRLTPTGATGRQCCVNPLQQHMLLATGAWSPCKLGSVRLL
jgi:hypothetical protein